MQLGFFKKKKMPEDVSPSESKECEILSGAYENTPRGIQSRTQQTHAESLRYEICDVCTMPPRAWREERVLSASSGVWYEEASGQVDRTT